MNTKRIPAIVMLLGGAVTSIVAYINKYTLKEMLIALTLSLVFFLILGTIIKLILDSFKLPEANEVGEDGEVVEKQGDSDADEGGTDEGEPSEESGDSAKS